MKHAIALGTIALIVSACSPSKASQIEDAAVKPVINEVFNASKTVDGASLKYPEGKAEMRLYRVEIPVGGKIPLHKHPAPMMVYVQGENSGSLRNTQVMSNGSEIQTVFKPGEAFLKGVDVPHYGENIGDKPTILWVTVTSVEGLPTTIFLD
ncbi:cupin domain-containing protein [bacterium]|nr:cupin domain-containing protein [bacterium]|tara:strand:- start:453 stop:908 length:456 start_codon:yes stop_codon:yes gene_type:complete